MTVARVYRDIYIYIDEIPEAMPAYLHLICSFSSYANDIAIAIREVFKHKVKGPEGLQREICEILCILQRAYPWYVDWLVLFFFRSQSAQYSKIYMRKDAHTHTIQASWILVYIYDDVIWYSAIMYGKSFNFGLDCALCLFTYFSHSKNIHFTARFRRSKEWGKAEKAPHLLPCIYDNFPFVMHFRP